MNPIFPDPNFRRTLTASDLLKESFNPDVITSATRLYSLNFSNVTEEQVEDAFEALGYHLGDIVLSGVYEPLIKNQIPDGDLLRYQYTDAIAINLNYRRLLCLGEGLYTQSLAECSVSESRIFTGLPLVRLYRPSRSSEIKMSVEFSDIPLPESTRHADKLLEVWGLRRLKDIFMGRPSIRQAYVDSFGPTVSFDLTPGIVLTTKPSPWPGDYLTRPNLPHFLTPLSVGIAGASQKEQASVFALSHESAFKDLARTSFTKLFEHFLTEQGGIEDELLYKYGKNLNNILQIRLTRDIALGAEGPLLDLSDIHSLIEENLASDTSLIDLRQEAFHEEREGNRKSYIPVALKPANMTTSTVAFENFDTRLGVGEVRLSSDAYDSERRAQLGERIPYTLPSVALIFPHESSRTADDTNNARWCLAKRIAKINQFPLNLKQAFETLREYIYQNRITNGIDYGADRLFVRADID